MGAYFEGLGSLRAVCPRLYRVCLRLKQSGSSPLLDNNNTDGEGSGEMGQIHRWQTKWCDSACLRRGLLDCPWQNDELGTGSDNSQSGGA